VVFVAISVVDSVLILYTYLILQYTTAFCSVYGFSFTMEASCFSNVSNSNSYLLRILKLLIDRLFFDKRVLLYVAILSSVQRQRLRRSLLMAITILIVDMVSFNFLR